MLVTVVRNDEASVAEVQALIAREGIERLVISPWPLLAQRAGISVVAIVLQVSR